MDWTFILTAFSRVSRSDDITIRMPVSLKEGLHTEASKRGISLNAYVLLLIERAHQG